jgi:hypothetical protein
LFLNNRIEKGKIMKSKKHKLPAIVFYSVIIALALGLPNDFFEIAEWKFKQIVGKFV